MTWIDVDASLDMSVEVDLRCVRLGKSVFALTPSGAVSFEATCSATGETLQFELSHGGPLDFGVSSGTNSRARLIGVAWIAACARQKRSALP